MNASSELGAVVQATESATDNILNISQAIDDLAGKFQLHADIVEDQQLIEEIQEYTIKILEACNFQDITG